VITSAILDPQSEADALEACIARRMAGGGDAPPRSSGFDRRHRGIFLIHAERIRTTLRPQRSAHLKETNDHG
jgi:hypothetical protein